jgi:hypothetical protein
MFVASRIVFVDGQLLHIPRLLMLFQCRIVIVEAVAKHSDELPSVVSNLCHVV